MLYRNINMHCYIGFLYKQIAALNLRHSAILLLHFCCKKQSREIKNNITVFLLWISSYYSIENVFFELLYTLFVIAKRLNIWTQACPTIPIKNRFMRGHCVLIGCHPNVDVFASCCEQIIVVVSPQVIESSRVVNAALPSA